MTGKTSAPVYRATSCFDRQHFGVHWSSKYVGYGSCSTIVTPQQTRHIDPMLGYCWTSVVEISEINRANISPASGRSVVFAGAETQELTHA